MSRIWLPCLGNTCMEHGAHRGLELELLRGGLSLLRMFSGSAVEEVKT